MSNITSNKDISYNFSQTVNDFSDNGLTYYPGKYKIRVRASYSKVNLPQINYEFTNCNATGRFGPTEYQCDASYNGTNVSVSMTM